MSITASIPVLHAGKDTVVRPEGEALLVRRPHEQTHIPLKAIGRVRVEGRTVTIELTSAPGTERTHVHRVWDVVDEAAGAAFAEAVNAALPERAEAVDGADLVTGERLYQPSYRDWLRRVKRGSLIATLTVVALCVLVSVAGYPATLIVIIPFGFLALPILALGVWLAFDPYEEWYLRRHGVRTAAIRLQGEGDLYAYPDPGGVVRTVRASVRTWDIEAAYDPRDPGRVVPLRSRSRRIRNVSVVLSVLVVGLAFTAAVVGAVVGAFFFGSFDTLQ
ncbi:hypothetical protein ACFVZH_05160 [Streptomyces sp. NPDC059534]|uniref:hypothetical protein n=1 Tax=Streptomyces sp. NPDC059534 TaxID=3346859 RepID=UPI003692DAF3